MFLHILIPAVSTRFGEGCFTLLFSSHNQHTTLNSGYLGSRNDEERSEMRYVMRIAEFSESSNL